MQPRPRAEIPGTEAALRIREGIGPALAMVAIALLAWLPSVFGAGFAFDDREAIEGNPLVEGSLPWTDAFRQDYWEHRGGAGHFRPLASLSLRLDRWMWGSQGAGFHATNIVLHGLVVFAAALLLRRVASRAGRWPWIGLALFAAHPLLADSVAWISGRSSMFAALFGLGAAIGLAAIVHANAGRGTALAAAFALGLLGTGLSMLGKEDGLIWALALPAVAGSAGRRAAVSTAAGCLVAVALVLALRAQALGSPWISAPNAPLLGVGLWDRLLVGGRALLEALRLVAWPAAYPPSYSGDPSLSAAALRAAPALGLLGLSFWTIASLAVGCSLIRRRTLLNVTCGLALAAWLPFLQIVPAGEVFAPRFLYLPLLFAIPLLQAGIETGFGRRATIAAAVLVLAACAASWSRGRVYASRGAYRMAVLAQRPDDAASWNDLGLHYEEEQRQSQAQAAWARAIELDPHYSRAWSNLGRAALDQGRTAQAVELLERAVLEGRENAVAHVNLGRARLSCGDARGAREAFRRAVQLAPGLARGWEGWARASIALGLVDEARAALVRTLELEPDNPRARAMAEDVAR